ncbi:MAG: hypothetical protein IJK35_04840 [Oscillospiraceae bacterium]|nr:hypothetical protein [Oscillospiraceae bacterium]
MRTRIRAFLLMCLMAAAGRTALDAFHSIRPPADSALPAAVYEALRREAEHPAYLLRAQDGYVAVCPARKTGAAPERTGIELATLRAADRAMLRRGIPAADRRSLLLLLEDLGS